MNLTAPKCTYVYSPPVLHLVLSLLLSTELQELLPGILNQLGPNNVEQLKEIYQSFAGADGAVGGDDDDVPELVDNFEAVSKGDDDVPDLVEE